MDDISIFLTTTTGFSLQLSATIAAATNQLPCVGLLKGLFMQSA